MQSTALPLRVAPDGKLAQGDLFENVLGILRIMAGTSVRAWPHAPWFGLNEAFSEAARRDRQDHEGLRDTINKALDQLGVREFQVRSLVSGAVTADGQRQFQITMVGADGRSVFGELTAG